MAEPTVIECSSACTVTVQHEINIPPFSLTLAEGSQIGGAILLVWAVAFAGRAAVRALNLGRSGEDDV